MPALPAWLTDPLWDQFATLLPRRETYHPAHPLGCHRRRIADRIVFDKLLQRCYERREVVIDAFFDLADAIITVRSLVRRAWTTHRWDNRPTRRP